VNLSQRVSSSYASKWKGYEKIHQCQGIFYIRQSDLVKSFFGWLLKNVSYEKLKRSHLTEWNLSVIA
jgi:hypothetical protein